MNNTMHLKVFITDDHPVIIYGVSAMLSNRSGFKVVGTANSGQEMQETILNCRPHVLLLDLNMPGSDFYENIAWVKEHSPWVKILAYSAYSSPSLVRSLYNEGVNCFLPKTATPDELCNAIETVFNGESYIIPKLAYAQSDNSPGPASPMIEDDFRKRLGLSRREQEVLVLISKGHSSQSIGKSLFISKYTVETHRKNILRKLDFNSSTELVKFAVQHGLV